MTQMNEEVNTKKNFNLHPLWNNKEYIDKLTKDYVRRIEYHRIKKEKDGLDSSCNDLHRNNSR
jgi:hypothetical protein